MGSNVRELMNFIHKLITHVKQNEDSETYIIDSGLIKKYHRTDMKTYEDDPIYNDYTWKTAQKIAFERAIKEANGNNESAIKLLGISRGTYFKWKKEFFNTQSL